MSTNRINLVLLGDSGCGKSTILLQLNPSYNLHDGSRPTRGVDFNLVDVDLTDRTIQTHIWDTSGSPCFRSMIQKYIDLSQGIIIVYDFSNLESVNNLEMWIQLANNRDNRKEIILVGNYRQGHDLDMMSFQRLDQVNMIINKYNLYHLKINIDTKVHVLLAIITIVNRVCQRLDAEPEIVKWHNDF